MSYRDEDDGSTSVGDALDAGMALGAPKVSGGADYAVVPQGATVADLESYLPRPRRIARRVTAHSLKGFLAYWALQVNATAGQSTVYADLDRHHIIGLVDDDRPGLPAWREHRIDYACPFSPEWKTWSAVAGQMRPQAAFARFIEENLPDIVEPVADTILQLALKLEATQKVSFGQSTRLETGSTSLRYQEEINGSDVTGNIELPKGFKLGIPVFMGGDPYIVPVLLRYAIPRGAGEGLQMGFVIDRAEKIIEAAFKDVIAAVLAGTKVDAIIEASPG